jgi:hypothetical protein
MKDIVETLVGASGYRIIMLILSPTSSKHESFARDIPYLSRM